MEIEDDENAPKMVLLLINENYSFRYDSFLTLYTYLLKSFLSKDIKLYIRFTAK